MAGEIDPAFANAWFNLALVQTINSNAPAVQIALGKYRQLVSEKEAQMAEDLLEELKSVQFVLISRTREKSDGKPS